MRRTLVVLGMILLCLVGLRGLIFHFPWGWPESRYQEAVASIPVAVKVLVWLAAVVVPVGLLVELIVCAPRRRMLMLPGRDGGQIMMRQSVVRKVVEQSVSELPEVDRLRMRASTGRKGLKVEIGLTAKAVRSVKDLEAVVRKRAEQSLRNVLGIEQIESINIRLDDVSTAERVGSQADVPVETPLPPPRAPLTIVPEPAGETKAEATPEHPDDRG